MRESKKREGRRRGERQRWREWGEERKNEKEKED